MFSETILANGAFFPALKNRVTRYG